ncbi:g7671 [Coccomyxa viridis]|uniref:G7671 protein n=1 Tax=Coccomyxa viridis TaxID=1274662 RepID=A0ABP1G523_9CHLO
MAFGPLLSSFSVVPSKVSAVMTSQLTLRSLARSSGIWARPISTSSARFTENKDKTMYEQVKDKAGEYMEKAGQAFTDSGKVGKQFTEDGKVGGKVEKETDTDSPLDSSGEVGKQFTSDGAVGGRVQEAAEKTKEAGKEAQKEANK